MDFYSRAKELLDSAASINEKINQTLGNEFGMPSDKVSRWFKSLFGMTIRDALKQKFEITKAAASEALILSNSVQEMQQLLNVSGTSAQWKGLLDRHFGYSTYASAKANYIVKQAVEHYNPTKEDNLSIIISQFIGDGSFDKQRRAIRLVHCMDQYKYLQWKVALINKAFPESYPVSKITKLVHTQGHEYVSWCSGNFSEKTFFKVLNMQPRELFDNLTPLGWCLWFLDDGGYYCYHITKTKKTHKIEIYVHNDDWRQAAVEELTSLGFHPNVSKSGSILLQDLVQIAQFINTFIKPFDHVIPECMKYKYDMKI